jgi:hypothetical protein
MTEERVPVMTKVEFVVGCSCESLVDRNQSSVTWIVKIKGTCCVILLKNDIVTSCLLKEVSKLQTAWTGSDNTELVMTGTRTKFCNVVKKEQNGRDTNLHTPRVAHSTSG